MAAPAALPRVPMATWVITLLMMLQIGGWAAIVSRWGDLLAPLICSASSPSLAWFGPVELLLLLAFPPLAAIAVTTGKLRRTAIIVGIGAAAGLAMQYAFLVSGTFHCDGP